MQLNNLPATRSAEDKRTRFLGVIVFFLGVIVFVSIFKNHTFDPAGKEYSHKHFTGGYRWKE